MVGSVAVSPHELITLEEPNYLWDRKAPFLEGQRMHELL